MTTTSTGAAAEQRAAVFLERLGYRILDRNYRTRLGELDLVARDGRTLVFVEVRSRAAVEHGTPAETISRAKRRKIAQAAQSWLVKHRETDSDCRFDVVTIVGDAAPELIRDAFRLDDC